MLHFSFSLRSRAPTSEKELKICSITVVKYVFVFLCVSLCFARFQDHITDSLL